ncbi:MAG TPA: protein kinase [Povalibacter sp.]|nr:protein kinase [Povalibacter sp.]
MQHLAPGDIKELLALLQTGLDLPDEQRQKWLDTLDPARSHLKQTVAALLQKQARHETDEFLAALSKHTQSPSGGGAIAPAPGGGAIVGPYRLLELIGEGGMSSVWLAEREDAVLKRKVALKLPHWWALSKFTDRVTQERDILASLEHPNIARLYDAGITADGQPYLALEYIEGEPIDVYCRDHELELRTRVQLVAQIARAVAYAHSRLIVHRDLKPSNILIDAQGQVHLLDFGIAKLIEEGGAANQALTQMGTVLLTPAYASPEQLLGQPVTTESDVYSLGLVAYELLTGYRPYTFNTATTTIQDILSVHVHRPSEVARNTADVRALRGDLDTIVLKALKKDARERYSSAAAFADDLDRYLRNDPVLAQPDSAAYRLRKFAVRHRLVVGAAAAVVVALAAGLIVARWQLGVARTEKRHAEEIKEFVASIFRSADPFFTGNTQMSAVQLLALARDRIDREMASQPQNAAELLLIVGEAQSNLEQVDDARKTLEKALSIAADSLPADSLQVAAGRAQLAGIAVQESKYDEAEQHLALAIPVLRAHQHEREGARNLATALTFSGYIAGERNDGKRAVAEMQEAVDVLRATLGENDSETILAMRQLAQEHLLMGDVPNGLAAARAAYVSANRNFGGGGRGNLLVETEDVYGRALVDSGELEAGIEHLRKSIADAEALLGPHADSVVSKLTWLARAQTKLGDLNGAIGTLQRAISASTDELNRARVQSTLGVALTAARRVDEAVQQLKVAVADIRRLDTTGTPWLGNAISAYGNALALAGRNDEAAQMLEANLATSLRGPAVPDSHNGLGMVALNRKDLASAGQHFAKAVELASAGPPSRVTVSALLGQGTTQLASGDFTAADATLRKAESTQTTIVRLPTPVLAEILAARGRLALAQGQRDQARELFTKVDEFWHGFAPESQYARDASRQLAASR